MIHSSGYTGRATQQGSGYTLGDKQLGKGYTAEDTKLGCTAAGTKLGWGYTAGDTALWIHRSGSTVVDIERLGIYGWARDKTLMIHGRIYNLCCGSKTADKEVG